MFRHHAVHNLHKSTYMRDHITWSIRVVHNTQCSLHKYVTPTTHTQDKLHHNNKVKLANMILIDRQTCRTASFEN